MKENEVIELFCYSKDEIENILTSEDAIDLEQLEKYLSDWVKLTCFNRKEITYLSDESEDKEDKYVTFTYEEFNKKYSKILNIQLVENPYSWLSVPMEMIEKWENLKQQND